MTGLSLADVIAVFSTRWGQFLLGVVIGGVVYLLGDAWQHRPRRKSWKPSTEPITEAELRAIFQSYTPRSFALPAHKGFRSDYQHEVVDLAERRRNRSIR